MRTCLDCFPCFFRQALEAGRMAGLSEKRRKHLLEKVAALLPKFSARVSPPETAVEIRHEVQRVIGRRDLYAGIKKESNAFALGIYGRLRKRIVRSIDPLKTAVETAILGNMIDFGAKSVLDIEEFKKRLLDGEWVGFLKGRNPIFHFPEFKKALVRARSVLYLADNAGETVFDRLLIEEIIRLDPAKKVAYAVKSGPTINDALEEDALASGLGSSAEIIPNGADAAGTVLSLCSPEFRRRFHAADMVIGKGQGNYESLSGARRTVFFLFMVKCPIVARDVGGSIGDVVLLRGGNQS